MKSGELVCAVMKIIGKHIENGNVVETAARLRAIARQDLRQIDFEAKEKVNGR
jgi:hypothetical protein